MVYVHLHSVSLSAKYYVADDSSWDFEYVAVLLCVV